jgi:hypothetical protein
MAVKYILALVALVLLVSAVVRIARDDGKLGPASRTWLIIALIFGAVSLWLWTGSLS